MIVVLYNIKWSGSIKTNPPTQVWNVPDGLSEQNAVDKAKELSEKVALDSQKIESCQSKIVEIE